MESKHAVALVGFCLSMPVWAAEYEVQVRVTVERGCQLIGSTRNAGIEPLGVLDFGRISRLDSGSGPLNAALLNQRVPRGGVGPHDGAGGRIAPAACRHGGRRRCTVVSGTGG